MDPKNELEVERIGSDRIWIGPKFYSFFTSKVKGSIWFVKGPVGRTLLPPLATIGSGMGRRNVGAWEEGMCRGKQGRGSDKSDGQRSGVGKFGIRDARDS